MVEKHQRMSGETLSVPRSPATVKFDKKNGGTSRPDLTLGDVKKSTRPICRLGRRESAW